MPLFAGMAPRRRCPRDPMAPKYETQAAAADLGSGGDCKARQLGFTKNSRTRPDIQEPIDVPDELRIIRTHWGLDGPMPFRQVSAVAAGIVARIAWRQKVAELRRRGDRVLAEFLAEIAADRQIATYLDGLIDRYLAIDPEALEMVGADRLPPTPLYEVAS